MVTIDQSQLLSPPIVRMKKDENIDQRKSSNDLKTKMNVENRKSIDEKHNFEFNSLFQEDDKFITSLPLSSSCLISNSSADLNSGNDLAPTSPVVENFAIQLDKRINSEINTNTNANTNTDILTDFTNQVLSPVAPLAPSGPLPEVVIDTDRNKNVNAKLAAFSSRQFQNQFEESSASGDNIQLDDSKLIPDKNSKPTHRHSFDEVVSGYKYHNVHSMRSNTGDQHGITAAGESLGWVDNLSQRQRKLKHDDISMLTFGKQNGKSDKSKLSLPSRKMSSDNNNDVGDTDEILFKEPWVIERSLLSDANNSYSNSNSNNSSKNNSLGSLAFYYKPKQQRNYSQRQSKDDHDDDEEESCGAIRDVRRFRKNYFTRAPQYELIRREHMEKVLPKESEREIQVPFRAYIQTFYIIINIYCSMFFRLKLKTVVVT